MKTRILLFLACVAILGCARRPTSDRGQTATGGDSAGSSPGIREVPPVDAWEFFEANYRDPAAAAVKYGTVVRISMGIDDLERLPGGRFRVTRMMGRSGSPAKGNLNVDLPASAAAALAGKRGSLITVRARLVDFVRGEMMMAGDVE